jgi:hypothetical protein
LSRQWPVNSPNLDDKPTGPSLAGGRSKIRRSENLARRHLTGAQLDAVAAEIANLRSGSQPGQSNFTKSKSANLHSYSNGTSLSDAAKSVGGSRRSVAKAKGVKDSAPKVFDALKEGKINTDVAAKIAARTNMERGKSQICPLPPTTPRKTNVQICTFVLTKRLLLSRIV